MEREDYSRTGRDYSVSYPPREPRTREAKRMHSGYEKFHDGDRPDNPFIFGSSAPREGDPGYNRTLKFNTESTMGHEYNRYKQYAEAAAAGAANYRTMSNSYIDHNAEKGIRDFTPDQHKSLGILAWDTSRNFKKNSELREKFDHDHIGRRTQDFHNRHKRQYLESNVANDDFNVKSMFHNRAIREEEYVDDDDEYW